MCIAVIIVMLLNLDRHLAVNILSKTISQVSGLVVAVRKSLPIDSHLLLLGFLEYKDTVPKKGKKTSPESH